MRVVRVQYTVQQDYAEQNKQNIEAVMSDLRTLDRSDFKYASYALDDGKTFMHLVHYDSSDADHLPSSLESFKHFQTQLKEHLEVPPKVESFALVESSFPVF